MVNLVAYYCATMGNTQCFIAANDVIADEVSCYSGTTPVRDGSWPRL